MRLVFSKYNRAHIRKAWPVSNPREPKHTRFHGSTKPRRRVNHPELVTCREDHLSSFLSNSKAIKACFKPLEA